MNRRFTLDDCAADIRAAGFDTKWSEPWNDSGRWQFDNRPHAIATLAKDARGWKVTYQRAGMTRRVTAILPNLAKAKAAILKQLQPAA